MNKPAVVIAAIIALLVVCAALVRFFSPAPGPAGKPAEGPSPVPAKTEEKGEIVALCGGSFRPPMEKLAKAFKDETGVTVALSLGQSEDLLPQVKLGKFGDVFLTHDPYAQYVKEAGVLSRYVVVGHVAPVIVVAKGNPKNVKKVEDLARADVRPCLPDPKYSTCGQMLLKLLDKKGIREAVEKNAGNAVFRTHAQSCGAIKLGTRDAGVVWNGIARNFRDDIEIVPTPYEYETEVRVTMMGLSYSKNTELVEKFLAFCEERGGDIFKEFGYVK